MQKKIILSSFSLVELMVVIAIIGILSSIALPSYRTYVIKSKISESLVLGAKYKNNFMEYHSINGSLPAANQNALVDMGASGGYCDTATTTCAYGITVNSQNVAYIYVGGIAGGSAVGARQDIVIRLQPNIWSGQEISARMHWRATIGNGDIITWECIRSSNVPTQYLPAGCT